MSNTKMHKLKSFIYSHKKFIFLFTVLFLTVLIPYILNFFISKYIGGIGDDKTWLSFWGTWLGSVLGGSITLVGLILTLNDNRKRDSSNRRLNVQPFLNIYLVGKNKEAINYDNDKSIEHISFQFNYDKSSYNSKNNCETKALTFLLKLENIGIGLARKVILLSLNDTKFTAEESDKVLSNLFIMKDNYKIVKLIIFINAELTSEKNLFSANILTINFFDILGNTYKQNVTFSLIFLDGNYSMLIQDISEPILIP